MRSNDSPDETPESQNFNFVQVSREYLRDMRNLTKKSPLAQEILLYLVEHMGRTSNAVVCSYATLQEVTGTSRATVGRALKILKSDRWIDTIKVGSATAYAVNARVFWQAGRNQRSYAVFQATVIASESEQASNYRELAKQPLRHIPFIGDSERVVANQNEQLPPPDQPELDLD